MQKDEMGWASSSNGGWEIFIDYWWERDQWVDNIKMDLIEIGWDDVDWIGLAQDRERWSLLNAVMNICVPYSTGKLSSGYTIREPLQQRSVPELDSDDDILGS
jgi:hypothetical protein